MDAKSAPMKIHRRMGANRAKRGAAHAPNPSNGTINKKRDDVLESEVVLTPRHFGWTPWIDAMRRRGAGELASQSKREGRMLAPAPYPHGCRCPSALVKLEGIEMRNAIRIAMLCCTFAVVLAGSVRADVDQLTAQQLHKFCVSSDQNQALACRFYILGVVEGTEFGDASVRGADGLFAERVKTHFCMPEQIPSARMVQIFENAVRMLCMKYPGDMQQPAVTVVNTAMTLAFPCK